jgi:hypothetical protein
MAQNVTTSISSEQHAERRRAAKARKAARRTAGDSGRPNPCADVHPNVARARNEAARQRQLAEQARPKADFLAEQARLKADFLAEQVALAAQHSEFQALEPGTMQYRVALEVFVQYGYVTIQRGESRVWKAYQAARQVLNVSTRQKPQEREQRIRHGRQVADTALVWAYAQLNTTKANAEQQLVNA